MATLLLILITVYRVCGLYTCNVYTASLLQKKIIAYTYYVQLANCTDKSLCQLTENF